MTFDTKLTELLKTDSRFVDESGELLVAAVQDAAWKSDRALMKLLLSDKEIKAKFFEEIEGHHVFDFNTFLDYISQKNFLANSYTRFRNRIGLTIDDKYLRERGEVALAWPYKDCVLEGGQTKEEEHRKEIFFNEILAHDEINRLLDPKVLTGWARYTTQGKEDVKELRRDGEGVLRENLIVKGNNLLALHSLKKQFAGKVKLIYIDPPYNTGNDSFGYNDNFNHSAWLTFMKNRLEVAKSMLTEDGAIFIQCDDNEQAYLKILCDEVFGPQNFINCIAVKMSEPTGVKMAHAQLRFPKIKEYLLAYKKSNFRFTSIDRIRKAKWDDEYKFFLDGLSRESRDALRDIQLKEQNDAKDVALANKLLKGVKLVSVSEKLKASNIAEKEQEAWKFENAWRIAQTVSSDSIRNIVKKMKNLPEQNVAASISKDGVVFFYNTNANLDKGGRIRITIADDFLYTNPCDFWQDIKTTGIAGEGGVSLQYGKKPEKLVERIVKMTTQPGEIVLDYHLGSGTTAAVAHKMGRQYIGIEQLDYGKNDSVVRLQNVIGRHIKKSGKLIDDLEYDTSGISKAVNWRGGGDFVYCELMPYNEKFMAQIEAAKSSADLLKIYRTIAKDSFLNWYINAKEPENAEADFAAVGKEENGVKKQKQLLAQMLDKNQLYVNLSEIDDAQFKVSKTDKALNAAFYGAEYSGAVADA